MWRLALLVVAACGRVDFDALADALLADAATNVEGTHPVATGSLSACAIASDGALSCWGLGKYGQLGIGTPYTSLPMRVGSAAWSMAAMRSNKDSGDHACGIQKDGSLWCWGQNGVGQLGNGSTASTSEPVLIDDGPWSAVGVGDSFSCGIEAGVLACWGTNAHGELANGGIGESHFPQQITASTWSAVAVGSSHVCAIRSDKTLWCWGNNDGGQLGTGTTVSDYMPAQIAGTWRAVATHTLTTCAISLDGTTWCWGKGDSGQLGAGNLTNQQEPTLAVGVPELASIAVGEEHACGITATGELWCWGNGNRGQLGVDVIGGLSATPIVVASGVTAVSAAGGQTCIAAGTLSCTGSNALGQLGREIGEAHTPRQVGSISDWDAVDPTRSTMCGVRFDGSAACWGKGQNGQIGDGAGVDRQVVTSIGAFAAVGVGGGHAGGIKSDGTLWRWGLDPFDGVERATPTQLYVGSLFGAGMNGESHGCAKDSNNDLYCRGDNTYGQLGDGTTNPSGMALVGGGYDFGDAGGHTTCAKAGTTLRCWGDGRRGQVGLAPGIYTTPQDVFSPVVTISMGAESVCVIDASGQLFCWGANDAGQLGVGDKTDRATPTLVNTDTDWTGISIGDQHACARKQAGTLWCWGRNDEGQLGIPDLNKRLVPTQVGTDTNWRSPRCADRFTCAPKLDNTLWCFGENAFGNYGDGTSWNVGFVAIP